MLEISGVGIAAAIVAGLIVIVFGLFAAGSVNWPWLQREFRFHGNLKGDRAASAGVLGVAMMTGYLSTFSYWLLDTFPVLGKSARQGRGAEFLGNMVPSCRREIPLLESVWKEYQSRNVVIVGIDVGETPDTVKPFVGSMGLTYPIWLDASTGTGNVDDTNELHTRFGGVGLLTSVFIGADGIIKKIYIGELNRAMLQEWLPQLEPE